MWFSTHHLLVAGMATVTTWASPIAKGWNEAPPNAQFFSDTTTLGQNHPPLSFQESHKVAKRELWGPHFPSLREIWDDFRDSPLADLTPFGNYMNDIGVLFGSSVGYNRVEISKGKLECWSDELWREHGGWCTEEGPNFPHNPDLHHPSASEPAPTASKPAPTVHEPTPTTTPRLVPTAEPKLAPITETLSSSTTSTELISTTKIAAIMETQVSTVIEEFNDVSGEVDFTPPAGSPETWSMIDMMLFYKHICIVDTSVTGTFAPLLDQSGRDLCFAIEYFIYAEADAAMAAALEEDDPTFNVERWQGSLYHFANATRLPLPDLHIFPSPFVSPMSLKMFVSGLGTPGGVTASVKWLLSEILSRLPSGKVRDSTPETRLAPRSAKISGRGATSSVPGANNPPKPLEHGGQGAIGLTSTANNPPAHAAPGGPEAIDSGLGTQTPSMTGALPPNSLPPAGGGVTLDHALDAPITSASDNPLTQANKLETAAAHTAREGRKFRRMNYKIHKLLNEVEECGYMHKETAAELVKIGVAETPETMEILGIPYTEVAAAIEGIKIFAELPYVPYSLPEGYCWRNADESAFGDHLEYFKRYSLRLGRDPRMYAMKAPPPTVWERLRPPAEDRNPEPFEDDEGVVNQVTNLIERPDFVTGLLAYSGLEGTMITPEVYSKVAIYGRWWANTHGFRNRYLFSNLMQGLVPHATELMVRLITSHRMIGGFGTLFAIGGAWGLTSYFQSSYILDKQKNGEPVREWQKPLTDGDWPWLTDVVTKTRTVSGRRVTETVTTSSQFTPAHFHPESMLNPWYTESLDPSLTSTAPAAADLSEPMTALSSHYSSLDSESMIPAGWYIPNPPVGVAAAVSPSSDPKPDRTRPGDRPSYQQPMETGSPYATPASSWNASKPIITKAPSVTTANSNGTQIIHSKLDIDSSTYHPPQQPNRATPNADKINDAKSLVFPKGIINVWGVTGFHGKPEDEPTLKSSISAPALLVQAIYHLIPTSAYKRPGITDFTFRTPNDTDQNSTTAGRNSSSIELSIPHLEVHNVTTMPEDPIRNSSNFSQQIDTLWQNISSSSSTTSSSPDSTTAASGTDIETSISTSQSIPTPPLNSTSSPSVSTFPSITASESVSASSTGWNRTRGRLRGDFP